MYLGIVRKYLSAKDGGVIQREGSVMVDCNICGEGERLSCLHSDSGRIRAVLSSLITSLKRLVECIMGARATCLRSKDVKFMIGEL
jgi:hypothetical protein